MDRLRDFGGDKGYFWLHDTSDLKTEVMGRAVISNGTKLQTSRRACCRLRGSSTDGSSFTARFCRCRHQAPLHLHHNHSENRKS